MRQRPESQAPGLRRLRALAPEFAALVPPDVFAGRVRQRASVFAPGTVIGFTPFGGYHLEELFQMGGERLTTLAYRQANVERRRAEFPPWAGQVLTVDAVQPLSRNLAAVLTYVMGAAAVKRVRLWLSFSHPRHDNHARNNAEQKC